MRFCDIVPDSEGYLSRINFCRITHYESDRRLTAGVVNCRKTECGARNLLFTTVVHCVDDAKVNRLFAVRHDLHFFAARCYA